VVVKIADTAEQDLATWTCVSHFADPKTGRDYYGRDQSSEAYMNAAVTAFEDRQLEIGAVSVVPIEVTSVGNVVLGCQIHGLTTPLHVRHGALRGVPLKHVHFRVGDKTYTGELYGRRSSNELPTCNTQPHPAVSCFTTRHDDFACQNHSFTLLAEASEGNDDVYEPLDTSLSFVFNASRGVSTVTLTDYVLVENLPRSVSCYGISGRSRGHVCLSSNNIEYLTTSLLHLAKWHTRLSIKQVTGTTLTCSNGTALTIMSHDCVNRTRHCHEDAGFQVVEFFDNITIRQDYAVRSCIISHYYCFDRRRVSTEHVQIYIAAQQKTLDLTERFITSDDVFPNCGAARVVKTAQNILTGYTTALATFMTVEYRNILQSPVFTCPCVQVPRTCPGNFPVVFTIVVARASYYANEEVKCTVFGKMSAATSMSALLQDMVCSAAGDSHHMRFLPPPSPKLEHLATVYGTNSKQQASLYCRSTLDDCRRSFSEVEMKLIPRKWTGTKDDVVYRGGHRLLVDPVVFATRYDGVQCRWKGSDWGDDVVRVENMLAAYHQLTCRVSETYHIDIEMVNETSVRCVLSYADDIQGCPAVKKLMIANYSCVGLGCKHGGQDMSLVLYHEDLTDNSTVYKCYAMLQDTSLRSLSAAKTTKQLKQAGDTVCDFAKLRPVILQHTFNSGDVHLTCRYPMDIGNIKHCQSGVLRAAIQLEIQKVTAGATVSEASKQFLLRVAYTLQADGTVDLYTVGGGGEFVQYHGYTTPSKNVMTVLIDRKFFDAVIHFGAFGVAVYAHCTFLYDEYTTRSREIGLVDAPIKAYRRAERNRRYPRLYHSVVHAQPSEFVRTWTLQQSHAVTTFVSMLAIALLCIFIVCTIFAAVIAAPYYKL